MVLTSSLTRREGEFPQLLECSSASQPSLVCCSAVHEALSCLAGVIVLCNLFVSVCSWKGVSLVSFYAATILDLLE